MIFEWAVVVLFLLPVPSWVATIILISAASRKPRITALTERATAAFVLSLAASAAAVLASARIAHRDVDPDVAASILIFVCVAVSVPSLRWLYLFMRGSFGEE